ncbi:hypothetical protein F5B22DRAFT_616256 [Xylaria bambusicola]|uniref:uncharacterized protein n=1 Tax=Xylaria bambusicola TaxID=326684 RepID=UPI0020075596|nr:uncharacterized protein F5B22DRAFT_616256 [Xylaria bambusicola]KAI0509624.1 hypothetical protein F5B22DRAFT_616256 [Xylaria bambusicola]
MASVIQDTETADTSHKQIQTEDDIYDLDDPYLIPKVLKQQPKTPGTVTCRFLAIPLNEANSFSRNIGQYGYIVHESRHKLIMRIPPQNTNLMDRIRQVWVSKYLAPFTECRITFDLPKWDKTTTIIIQCVPNKANKSTDSSLVHDAADDLSPIVSEASMRDSRVAVQFSRPSGGEGEAAEPQKIRRVSEY